MSHIGYDYDKQIIPNLSGVDVVVGGDSPCSDRPAWRLRRGLAGRRLPTEVKNKDGKRVCLVQAWGIAGGGRAEGQLRRQRRRDGCAGTPRADGQRLQDRRRGGLPGGPGRHRGRHQGQRLPVSAGAGRRRAGRAAAFQGQGRHVQRQPGGEGAAGTVLAPRAGGPGSRDYSRSGVDCNTLGSVSLRGGDIQQLVAQAYLEVGNASYGGADISLQKRRRRARCRSRAPSRRPM